MRNCFNKDCSICFEASECEKIDKQIFELLGHQESPESILDPEVCLELICQA